MAAFMNQETTFQLHVTLLCYNLSYLL